MPPFDREAVLKAAEKALKLGKVDAAIAEYLKVVEAQPRDWNSANALGDLYVRSNRPDLGIEQYIRIADHLAEEGFYPKALALFKKVIKLKPDHEYALLQSGDLAVRQGTLADAKQFFLQVAERRKARGDRKGAAEVAIRLGTLDPEDLDARLRAGQLAAETGDTLTALREFREVAAKLAKQDRPEQALEVLAKVAALDPADVDTRARLAEGYAARNDFDRARSYLSPETAGANAGLWLTLAEMELRDQRLSEGKEAVVRALRLEPAHAQAAVVLGCRLAETSAEAAYQPIDAVVDIALADGDYAAAAVALGEFTTRVRSHLVALMRLVEVCVDGGLEATTEDAQAALAEAYLDAGRAMEARIISEDLLGRDPLNTVKIHLFRRALVMLGEADPDAVIADRLSGESPFLVIAQMDLNEGESGFTPTDADEPGRDFGAVEIDITEMLNEPAAPPAPPPPRSLDQVFRGMRDESHRGSSEEAAAEQYRLALTYHEMGMMDDAIKALEGAARSPRQRFDAASMLGRLFLERKDTGRAIEWLERAAEAPAPTADAGRALLYDLATTLEAVGEHARALAAFVELESESGGYRDVAGQIERLSKVQARG